MNTHEYPLYREALQNHRAKETIKALTSLGGEAGFSQIERNSSVKGSTLVYHLNRLVEYRILESPTRGTYRLRYLTPLCFVFPCPGLEYAYFGLLGKREGWDKPEPQVALDLLGKAGMRPSLINVVTSPDALAVWSEFRLPYQWLLCYEEEIIDIDCIKGKVLPQLTGLLKSHIVVLDCTSATKPATIAFYELAKQFMLPLVYIYEEQGWLKWLQSKETITQELGL